MVGMLGNAPRWPETPVLQTGHGLYVSTYPKFVAVYGIAFTI